MADEEEKVKEAYKKLFDEWWQYQIHINAEKKDKPIEPSPPDDPMRHTSEPPLTSPSSSSGPEELKQTQPKGPLAPNVEMGFIEVCPYCDETLEVYHTHNILTGEREWRCKKCYGELKRSPRGWVKKDEDEEPDKRRSTFGF